MRLLHYSDKPLAATPRATWQPYKHNGRGTVVIRCPSCAKAMSLPHHRIDHDGVVLQPVTCPFVKTGRCTMKKAKLVLLGWIEHWAQAPN